MLLLAAGVAAAHHRALVAVLLDLELAVAVAAQDEGVVVLHRQPPVARGALLQVQVLPALGARDGLENDGGVILTCAGRAAVGQQVWAAPTAAVAAARLPLLRLRAQHTGMPATPGGRTLAVKLQAEGAIQLVVAQRQPGSFERWHDETALCDAQHAARRSGATMMRSGRLQGAHAAAN